MRAGMVRIPGGRAEELRRIQLRDAPVGTIAHTCIDNACIDTKTRHLISLTCAVTMENDAGQIVDLYVPRKCSATNRLIGARDHASVQINVGEVCISLSYLLEPHFALRTHTCAHSGLTGACRGAHTWAMGARAA